MEQELLRIVVTQKDEHSMPQTRIFENGIEVFTYTKFSFSCEVNTVPIVNGEKAILSAETATGD